MQFRNNNFILLDIKISNILLELTENGNST